MNTFFLVIILLFGIQQDTKSLYCRQMHALKAFVFWCTAESMNHRFTEPIINQYTSQATIHQDMFTCFIELWVRYAYRTGNILFLISVMNQRGISVDLRATMHLRRAEYKYNLKSFLEADIQSLVKIPLRFIANKQPWDLKVCKQ